MQASGFELLGSILKVAASLAKKVMNYKLLIV